MNTFLALVLVSLALIHQSDAWLGRWGMGGYGLGLGGLGYGGLGYGGLGYGGLGYGGLGYGGLGYGGLGYGGLGYGFGKRAADLENRIECLVAPTKNMITCDGGKVECEIVARFEELNTRFDMFGIEFCENKSFRLYPKLFTDSSFSNYKAALNNGSLVELSIFTGLNENRGIMVRDSVCYTKLVDLFSTIKNPVKVDVAVSKTISTKVVISGFVL